MLGVREAERSPALARNVLEGGGEMGALMRAIDWSKKAIGPVERWPRGWVKHNGGEPIDLRAPKERWLPVES